MRGKTILAQALLLAACPASAAAEARPAPQYYGCLLARAVAGARFTMRATVQLDGRVSDYLFILWGYGGAPRVDIRLSWAGPVYGPMTQGAFVHMVLTMRRQDQARIEVRRIVDGVPAGEALAASPSLYTSIHMLDLAWDRIDAAARAPGGVAIQLVRWDGRVMAETRIDAAGYDGAVAAMAAAREEMAAMVADFRHRCRGERDVPIVVTGAF